MRYTFLLYVVVGCISGIRGFEDKTVGQWLKDNNFTELTNLLTRNGIITTLSSADNGPFTLFAPTNAAFAAVPKDTLDGIAQDSLTLNAVLTYHVINGFFLDYQITDGATATSSNGQILNFSVQNGMKEIQNVTISKADILLNNGAIHIIDAVLIPPVLPPTETIAEILLRKQDVFFSLNAFLSITDLEPVLMAGNFTLFAPINSAFDAVTDSLVSFSDPNAITVYSNLLLNHVVSGAYEKNDLTDGMTLTAMSGKQLIVHLAGANGDLVNAAPVDEWDLLARNGVVHVISAVIL